MTIFHRNDGLPTMTFYIDIDVSRVALLSFFAIFAIVTMALIQPCHTPN